MIILLDVHLPPSLAQWIEEEFKIECKSFESLNWLTLDDEHVFINAKSMNAIVITKDNDFLNLLLKHKAPPKIIWLTCGNTSKQRLKEILSSYLSVALKMLNDDDLVEISGK
jgi:predicted nuclease of predicted toxin-antitoxin system